MRLVMAALAALVLALPSAAGGGTSLGRLAFVRHGQLVLLDLDTRRERVLVPRGAREDVRFSADGRYVAFNGGVVSVAGGRVMRLRGIWAPQGHGLVTLTRRGGVVLGGPGMPVRRLLPDGFGAHALALDPTGKLLAVSRAFFRREATPLRREIWVVEVASGARRLVYRMPRKSDRTPLVVGWAPGGFILFTRPLLPAISINLDGLPLDAVAARGGPARRVVPLVLSYDEFIARCERGLVVAAGLDRFTTRGKRLVVADPPSWRGRGLSRDRSRSWVSPSCSPDGRWVAASAGRNWIERRFGLERRSIWLLSLDGRVRRRLTSPPRGATDELPRFIADGRSILFIRTEGAGRLEGRGHLLLWRDGRVAGPLADLGAAGNYYGHYAWASQTDWHP